MARRRRKGRKAKPKRAACKLCKPWKLRKAYGSKTLRMKPSDRRRL